MTVRSLRFMLSVAILVAIARPAAAQDAGAFARQGFGPRGVAMGNALVAVRGASPYYNPALAPFAPAQQLSVSVASLSFDRSTQTVQFSTPQRNAGFAVGLLHAGVSDIDGRDNAGFHTGMVSVDEFAGFLAFGLRVGTRASIGLSIQGFRSDLYAGLDPVSTVGLDLGVTVMPADGLRLGFVLDDLLARFDWNSTTLYGEGGKTTRDNFPRRVRLGASLQRLDGRLLLAAEYQAAFTSIEVPTRRVEVLGTGPVEFLDLDRVTVRRDMLRVGAEFLAADIVTVRAGVDRIGSGGVRPAAGLAVDRPVGTLGLRLTYTYAREPYGTGSAHFAGMQLTFNDR